MIVLCINILLLCIEWNSVNGFNRYWSPLQPGGKHVKEISHYAEHPVVYYDKCGNWAKWWKCDRYYWRTVKSHTEYQCETGWINNGESQCLYAICDGRSGSRACTISYGKYPVKLRTGKTFHESGGTCYKPESCTDCAEGAFPDGPYCRMCKPIDHCNLRRCSDSHSSHCEYCEGEVKPKQYHRAYKPTSDKEHCEKACSWRPDSRRCYPGHCKDELEINCRCTDGFGGHHCEKITNDVEILENTVKLVHPKDDDPLEFDPNDPNDQDIRWTNMGAWKSLLIKIELQYKSSATKPHADHFVKNFKYGITYAIVNIVHHIAGSFGNQIHYKCFSNRNEPKHDITCSPTGSKKRQIDNGISSWDYRHADTLSISFTASNGGKITFEDREKKRLITKDITGRTINRRYVFNWDLVLPFQDCVSPLGTCNQPPVDAKDTNTNPKQLISWRRWKDDLSGIGHYNLEVFELFFDGSQLKQREEIITKNTLIDRSKSEEFLTFPKPGMYSVVLIVFDKAKNKRFARCLVFYDNMSTNEVKSGKRIIVKQSSLETNHTWVSKDDLTLIVLWTDRFLNKRHKQHGWLNKVESLKHIAKEYDDIYGIRTVSQIPNIHGIVRFELQYKVYGPDLKNQQYFLPTSNVLSQSEDLNIHWKDGYRLDITVRAYDIFDGYVEDTTTVYKDTSPPSITDLWLTKGDRVNISIHSIADFTEMTIEWKAFDYDSGLNQVEWRLYNNYTGIEEHGKASKPAQGKAKNLQECQQKYNNEPRGPSCYCTMFHGCYHKSFHVKPLVVNDSGITPGKEKGVHDSDYYVEVTVINNALLKTTKTIKITIDISPPHEGFIHDGIKGYPEIDYQQDSLLKAHWEGFFDRESGVDFYSYVFSEHCFTNQEMHLSTQKQKTYNTFASFNASREGTYFISVTAVNRASESSNVVCSDGVTFTTTVPYVTNFTFDGVRRRDQFTIDGNGTLWLVDGVMIRHKAENVTNVCSNIVPLGDVVNLLPEGDPIDNIDMTGCKETINSSILAILPGISLMTWNNGIDEDLIYNYEIGLSSTTRNRAPDIYAFSSSKHHKHCQLRNPNLVDGKEFYVVIKTIGQSGMKGYQDIGPFIIDTTTPLFNKENIYATLHGEYLVARWSIDAFKDQEDPFPLQYEFAVGQHAFEHNIQEFFGIKSGGPCTTTAPPTCTVVSISTLKWSLHPYHDYYITLKVTNAVGLSTTVSSLPYRHDPHLPTKGVVFDILPSDIHTRGFKDIEDVDFTSNTRSIAVVWYGFHHQHGEIKFRVCLGTKPNICDILSRPEDYSTDTNHTFRGLHLTLFKTYFITVEATSSSGSVSAASDGFTVISTTKVLIGIILNDGTNCSNADDLQSTHHEINTRPTCSYDIDWQISTSSVSAYWTIPFSYLDYTKEAYISIDERAPIGEFWKQFVNYTYVGKHLFAHLGNLNLQPGRFYRTSLKLCVENLCFPPVKSNGFIVLHNYPKIGTLFINIGEQQLEVTFEKMYDPDIDDFDEALSVVNMYEWAIGNDIGIHTRWNLVNSTKLNNLTHIGFVIPLNGSLDFSKCRKIYVRGYNKAGMWSVVSSEIKQCNVKDSDVLIVPNLVIDALGKQEISGDGQVRYGFGRDIFLGLNEDWKAPDADYTPYKNVLSAVWPKLHHRNYTWALIEIKTLDVTMYYKDDVPLLTDPCSHPDVIRCGKTGKEFANVLFRKDHELHHGKRFRFCVYASKTSVSYEKWIEELEETYACSDGITVDLTPPIPGRVWIGVDPYEHYQYSTSDIYVSWESFTDVEEFKTSVHSYGIKEYHIGIGSTIGGIDIYPYTNVGIVNHLTLHDLRLQNGHEYFASVKAFDFTGKSSIANSQPIKIDNTAPEQTTNQITIQGRHLSNMTSFNACWRDVFIDKESGVDHYQWGVGSHKGYDDIVPFSKTLLDCSVSAKHEDFVIHEGHAYFITVKAVNRAHLVTSASSLAYLYDQSPPVTGSVYDGVRHQTSLDRKDKDYQAISNRLSCYWEGFHDPHSTIKMYYISIGTCHRCHDIIMKQAVGITSNFTLFPVHLVQGYRYYSTIMACNTADLCSSVTSDGVIIDSSPPTVGVVQDGVEVYDTHYQSMRNYIAGKWYGFTDPQSGLHSMTWRAGTKSELDDIIISTHLPISALIIEPNLSKPLPIGRRIFITVRIYNKAGLFSEASSNGFIVDVTAPIIRENVSLNRDFGSIRPHSVVFRSSIKVRWAVEDKESFIERQYISISPHQGGDFNASSIQLNGIVREYTFSRTDLHDGVSYTVHLIVCNRAKLCTESVSETILVDSSPPTPGMFAIHTDHAANLKRHIDDWMTWSRYSYKIWLSWLGFTDIHTGIDKYYVTVGSKYMQDDLNEVPGSPQEFVHNTSGIDKGDEGFVQTFVIKTQNLRQYEHIFVSVWAVNTVGLQSQMIHSQFRLVPGGSLELIRRCSSVTCHGHCVCSSQDDRCALKGLPCHDITNDNPNTLIHVYDITDLYSTTLHDVKYTAANLELAARWQIVHVQGLLPLWYEWSVGLTSKNSPQGVFDNLKEKVWHHAGKINQAYFSLKRGKTPLKELISYSFFVRAWYSDSTFADFKSDGVTILSRSLAKSKLKGTAICEQMPGHWKKDIDYIKLGYPFTIRWSNVFIDAADIIDRFNIYLSTFPGGYDVHVADVDLPGTVTSYNISRIPLAPGVVFFSNVVAYSYSGIHSTASSDGITVDIDVPTVGFVKDGIGMFDIDYQDNNESIGASWHGFSDRDSVIAHYMWCVQTMPESQPCNIRNWENVGIQTSVTRALNASFLLPGTRLQSLVFAVDIVGHKSDIERSNGVYVDTTPPIPTDMIHVDDNMATNPSFEMSNGQFVEWDDIYDIKICELNEDFQPFGWNISFGSCVGVIKSHKDIAYDGRSCIVLFGYFSQTITNLTVGSLYRVTFVTSHSPFFGTEIAHKEGFVAMGDNQHAFLLYTKQDEQTSETSKVSWHHHTFYFRSFSKSTEFRLGSISGKTGLMFDDLKIQPVFYTKPKKESIRGEIVHRHMVTIHDWSSVHASWNLIDPESPIIDYTWAIGYTEGSTEVQRFTSIGVNNFAYNYNVTLAHTSVIYVTIIATNAAGLMTKVHARSLLVDLTPPNIIFVNDGIGSDIDAQTVAEISANWEVEDGESGLQLCEWAIGYQPYGNELQSFEKLPNNLKLITKVFNYELLFMRTIHVTIRCKNNAGLHTSLSSDGVVVSDRPPSAKNAQLEIISFSKSEYNARNNYQTNNHTVRLKWTGFMDIIGLDSYLVIFKNMDTKESVITRSITAVEQDMTYCILQDMDLPDGNYTVSVKAVNKMFVRSDPILARITISSSKPKLNMDSTLDIITTDRTVKVSWKKLFSTHQYIFYEVSAGTVLGSADIIQWQETKNTFIEFAIPPQIKSLSGLIIYVTIRGINDNGMYYIYKDVVKLN